MFFIPFTRGKIILKIGTFSRLYFVVLRDSRIEYLSGYSLNIPFRAALTGLKVFQKSIRFYQIFKSRSQRSERRYRFRDRFGY